MLLLACGAGAQSGAPQAAKSAAKNAQKEFARAHSLADKGGDLEAAIEEARHAAADDPTNVSYAAYAELLVQVDSARKLQASDELRRNGSTTLSDELLQRAMKRDPANPDLLNAARQAAIDRAGDVGAMRLSPESTYAEEPMLAPQDPQRNRDFHLRGSSATVLKTFFDQYGIKTVADPSMRQKQVRFDVGEADYVHASAVLAQITHTFLVPVSANEAVIYDDTQENRRSHEHQVVQTFEVTSAGGAADVAPLLVVLRTIFDLRTVTQKGMSIAIRGPREQVAAAAEFLQQISSPRAELMLEVRTYEISRTLLRNMGINFPLQYQVMNVGSVVHQLGATDLQDLANKIAAGTIDPSLITPAISGLLQQLQNQQGLFIGLVGGGVAQSAVIFTPPSLNFSETRGSIRILRSTMVRAAQGTTATFRDGFRYPIVTTEFSSALNLPILNRLPQSTFIPPPQVQYEDLGLTLKVTPLTFSNTDVRSAFEVEIRQLGGTSVNGIPVISNRQFSGTVDLRKDETSFIVGSISSSDIRSKQGLPGLSEIPGLAVLGGSIDRNESESELLIAVTPRVVRMPARQSVAEELSEKRK